MTELKQKSYRARVGSVQQIVDEIRNVLQKHQIVEDLVQRQEMPRHRLVEGLVQRQNLSQLKEKLDTLHPADIAVVLEQLPLDLRLIAWDLVKTNMEGDILLEVSDAVRETLIAEMDAEELVAATEQLDADEIADLAPDLPDEVIADVFRSLSLEERSQLRAAMSYPEDTVGGLMDFEMVTVREDVSLDVVLRYLRRLDELPTNTDKLFVVDRRNVLRGALSISDLIVASPDSSVSDPLNP